MNKTPTQQFDLKTLDSMTDAELTALDWKNLNCFNSRLLELHSAGSLGNETAAKLPRLPIRCIDSIGLLDEERIEASFQFPESASDWPFTTAESLEMLFQDQLDQLVGFWAARKVEGIGRALSSGVCKMHRTLDFQPGKEIRFLLEKRKWMTNKTQDGGTAVFNARIVDATDNLLLETRNVIVGILRNEDIAELRQQYGGLNGIGEPGAGINLTDLNIPIYDTDHGAISAEQNSIYQREATQVINPQLWPLHYHFRGDPVVPGNFGTHGLIQLLKQTAVDKFGLKNPQFVSLSKKTFAGMIFEDPKQIRFKLEGVSQTDSNTVVAKQADLYLEDSLGNRLIDTPIYLIKDLTVVEHG